MCPRQTRHHRNGKAHNSTLAILQQNGIKRNVYTMYFKKSTHYAFLALAVAAFSGRSLAQNTATTEEKLVAKSQAQLDAPIAPCGFEAPTVEQIIAMKEQERKRYGATSICRTLCSISKHFCKTIKIPTYVFNVHGADGSGKKSQADINQMVDDANQQFDGLRIKLELQDTQYVSNTVWYQAQAGTADEETMKTQLKVGGLDVLTVYVKYAVDSSGSRVCGYAFLAKDAVGVGKKDGVVMDQDCLLDGTTFAHEVGQ